MKDLYYNFAVTFGIVCVLLLALDLTIIPSLNIFYIPIMGFMIGIFSVLNVLIREITTK